MKNVCHYYAKPRLAAGLTYYYSQGDALSSAQADYPISTQISVF